MKIHEDCRARQNPERVFRREIGLASGTYLKDRGRVLRSIRHRRLVDTTNSKETSMKPRFKIMIVDHKLWRKD